MLEVRNRTAFAAALAPATDKDGSDWAVVVVKGTFGGIDAGKLAVADEQVPVFQADECHGEPGKSSIKYALDVCLRKPGTDVALVGQAYAPGSGATEVDVGLKVGPLRSIVRVLGDRVWYRGVTGWQPSSPRPFQTMPLVYERAFGGTDTTGGDPSRTPMEPRNPVGLGFAAEGNAKRLDGLPLPNLERPDALISSWQDRPEPAGFGFIGCHWEPRCRYGGTYDERWKRERAPLLPDDFDDRYHNAAHPSLISPRHFEGGEAVRVVNASPKGQLDFGLPRYQVRIEARLQGKVVEAVPVLDTVVIEPDASRVVLTWRAAVPCTRKFLYLEHVTVTAKALD